MPRTRRTLSCLIGVCAWTFLAGHVAAQAPTRDRFFIGFGIGGGSLGIEDADSRESSVTAYFKIGGALSPSVLLGAESSAWYKEVSGVDITSSSLNVVAYVYPNPTGGLFLKGGVGVASLEVDAGAIGAASDNGVGLTLGLGYDIGFGGRFALTPVGSFHYASFDGGSTNTFDLNLGFNWY